MARRSITLDMRPVKMTTEPRSIWYVEALVIVSPMYIVLVPMMSHHAWSGKEARRWAATRRGSRACTALRGPIGPRAARETRGSPCASEGKCLEPGVQLCRCQDGDLDHTAAQVSQNPGARAAAAIGRACRAISCCPGRIISTPPRPGTSHPPARTGG